MLFSLSKEWNIGQSLQSLTNLSQLSVQMTVSLTKLIYFSLPLLMVNSTNITIIEVSITVIRCFLPSFQFCEMFSVGWASAAEGRFKKRVHLHNRHCTRGSNCRLKSIQGKRQGYLAAIKFSTKADISKHANIYESGSMFKIYYMFVSKSISVARLTNILYHKSYCTNKWHYSSVVECLSKD